MLSKGCRDADRDIIAGVATIYITGHRNPDTDSIASAIGYAELKNRLDFDNEYVPVRLGDCNAQTRWLLERSGAPEPTFLPHVMPRARDVMHTSFPTTSQDAPIREAGLAMAQADLELVPIVDEHGALCGVLTERELARRYIRESRRTSTLEDAPTYHQRGRGRAGRRAGDRRRPSAVGARVGPVDGRQDRRERDQPTGTWSSSATAPTRSCSRSSAAPRS